MTALPFQTVAVIGLGLIGGSLARDLAERHVRVIGYDRDTAVAKRAERDGILSAPDSFSDVQAADVVVLAVPIEDALPLLATLAPHLKAARLVTDVCSTKATIVRGAEDLGLGRAFVGSHPLAGGHRWGWDASRTGLFATARAYVCPSSTADESSIALTESLWRFVGAVPERIDADSHDREVAWTSHLPHVASAALATALADAAIAQERLGPGGRDATRLAASDPGLWTGIALDNAAPLQPAIEALERVLRDMRLALARHDRDAVQEQFASAYKWSSDGKAH
jgi:prephenate dehydrogenase